MPRNVDPALIAALAAPVLRPCVFVRIGFLEPVQRWTGRRKITFDGREYIPVDGVLDVGEISDGTDTAQPQLSVTISGITLGEMQRPLRETSANARKITFECTLADQVWTATEDGEVTLHCIAAGGGPDGFEGGVGGYSRVKIRVKAGDSFAIVVGQSGINLTTSYGFGGVGQGTAHQHNGGGMSGVFAGSGIVSATDFSRAVVVAGGGGAGGWNGTSGTAGRNGNDSNAGGRPTFQGIAATGNASAGIGGGGGGWRGGGTIAGQNLWGLGGSGYASPTHSIDAPIVAGAPWPRNTPPVPAELWDGIAGKSGENGLVILEVEPTASLEAFAPEATVHLGALDESGNLIGVPQLLFSGTVDNFGATIQPTAVTARIDLIGGRGTVEASTGQKYSDANQRIKFPGDLGLEYVAAMSNQTLTWGAF